MREQCRVPGSPAITREEERMSTTIGIDLGTTYSAAALVRDGVPVILPHGDERIMPSVVGLTPGGELLSARRPATSTCCTPSAPSARSSARWAQEVRVALGDRDVHARRRSPR